MQIVSSVVNVDSKIKHISTIFDYNFDGVSKFKCHDKPIITHDYNIGLIVGSSGSGKSILLKEFGEEESIEWDLSKGIISHFESERELMASGLNSVPVWCRPFNVLSIGEKHRAEIARRIKDNAVIDEFTSTVDRYTAKSMATSVSKYIKNNDIKSVVIASCHRDIVEWLEPDWVFDCDMGVIVGEPHFHRPKINISIYESSYKMWSLFENHHYLSEKINKSCKCYIALWDDVIVGFVAVLSMPCGSIKNAYRESRLVVLPEFQGMGIGTKLSDSIAQIYIDNGFRYFSRTAHIRMGNHRDSSMLWKKTSKYKKVRCDAIKRNLDNPYNNYVMDTTRSCYSHEYVGNVVH